jgi:hypothetical protein
MAEDAMVTRILKLSHAVPLPAACNHHHQCRAITIGTHFLLNGILVKFVGCTLNDVRVKSCS